MTQDLTPEEMIRANAEMVLAIARGDFGQDIGFNEPGVRWLNGYIQGLVEQGDVEASEQLCDNLGSFLGTCIIETFGGKWQDTEYGWAVVIKDDFAVFPFNKTLKHLTEGQGESVLGLYRTIPAMLAQAPASSTTMPSHAAEPTGPLDRKSRFVMSKLGRLFRRR